MKLLLLILIIILILNISYSERFTNAERYFPSRCTHLGFSDCLENSECGWLIDGNYNSRCLRGTRFGPLNPKLQPDAEYSPRGNIQYDRWIYSTPNPFIVS